MTRFHIKCSTSLCIISWLLQSLSLPHFFLRYSHTSLLWSWKLKEQSLPNLGPPQILFLPRMFRSSSFSSPLSEYTHTYPIHTYYFLHPSNLNWNVKFFPHLFQRVLSIIPSQCVLYFSITKEVIGCVWMCECVYVCICLPPHQEVIFRMSETRSIFVTIMSYY